MVKKRCRRGSWKWNWMSGKMCRTSEPSPYYGEGVDEEKGRCSIVLLEEVLLLEKFPKWNCVSNEKFLVLDSVRLFTFLLKLRYRIGKYSFQVLDNCKLIIGPVTCFQKMAKIASNCNSVTEAEQDFWKDAM